MTTIYYSCLFIITLASPIPAQKDLQFPGRCPFITRAKTNLNEIKLAGRWFEVLRFPSRLVNRECVIADIKNDATSRDLQVHFVFTDLSSKRNSSENVDLIKTPDNTIPSYDVYVSGRKKDVHLYILDTDYRRYSVVWGCFYNPKTKRNTQRLSVFSRNKVIDRNYRIKAMETLKANGIDHRHLREVQQSDTLCGRTSCSGGKTLIVSSIINCLVTILLIKTVIN